MKPRKHGHIPSKTGTRFPRWLNDDSMVWNHSHMAIRNSRLEWETQKKKISSSITNTPEIPRNPTLQVFQPLEIKVFGDFGRVPAGLETLGPNRWRNDHWLGDWAWSEWPDTEGRDWVAAIGSRFLGDKKCQENEQSWRNSTFFELDYRLPKCINIDTMKIHQKRRYCFWGNHGFSYCRC